MITICSTKKCKTKHCALLHHKDSKQMTASTTDNSLILILINLRHYTKILLQCDLHF